MPGAPTGYEALMAALLRLLFVMRHIEFMLPPAPMNKAEDANNTNAINSAYSTMSWPDSSALNRFKGKLTPCLLFLKLH